MKQLIVIDSDTNGFILADLAALDNTESLRQALNVLLDPDGETCAVDDCEGRNWPDVVEEARRVAQELAVDRLAVVVAEEGYIHVAVQDEPPAEAERARVRETHRLRLRVESGSIAISDGMFLFEGADARGYDEERVDVPPGVYEIALHGLDPDPEVAPIVGVFGDDDSPAIIVQLTKVETAPDCGVDARVDMSRWTLRPVSGAIAAVTVTKIEGGEAHSAIQLTSHVQSGRARFTIPTDANVVVGDECWVLLERDEGKYWTASLIEE